jgi:hypothetical protein
MSLNAADQARGSADHPSHNHKFGIDGMHRILPFVFAGALAAGCSRAPSPLSDAEQGAIRALVEKEGQGKVREIRRESGGLWRVSTARSNEPGGGLFGVMKAEKGWVIVEHGVWIP